MTVNKEKKFVSVVVYLHNDEKNVDSFFDFLFRILNNHFDKYEIICVNDFSVDNTVGKLNEIANKSVGGIITVVNMSFYQGKEKSMNAGIDLAIGDFVYSFDKVIVDYDESLVMDVYHKMHEGYDIVSTSNNIEKFSSKLFYAIFNFNAKNKVCTETFSIISRRAINRVKATSITIPYRKVVYQNCGLSTKVINYKPTFIDKSLDKSDIDARFDNAIVSLILYTDHAYNFAMALALIMMVVTLVGVIYAVVVFFVGRPVEGYTTTMLVITSSFFALFILMAVLVKYASIILDLVYKKQTYLIKSIDKLSNRGEE